MYDNLKPQDCTPPGTHLETVPHPNGDDRTIEKAIFMEHRFAFFFWMKWRNRLAQQDQLQQPAPTLVTIDWHRDLAPIPADQKENLQNLDQQNLSDVANYVWAQFAQTNDAHIFCAAWLNLIGDVVLLQNTTAYQESTFIDMNGNQHAIYEINDFEQFQQFMQQRKDHNIFFDIDLDYFVHGKGKYQYSDDFERYSDEEIQGIMHYRNPVFQHILPHIDGFTIAQEPGYCGGIVNSCHIMTAVHNQLFDSENNWRHLTEEVD
ncbi:MAG: hypothetical protein U5J63_14215 [Fodinibius sp.]|nr:hypothetical protein [Fodinibius sp.]